jgi:peptide-methionine (R)-S-oxide reductase
MLLAGGAVFSGAALTRFRFGGATPAQAEEFPIMKSQDEWKRELSPDQFRILREHGTEYPGTSALLEEHRPGTFVCSACENALFSSETKFESGTGWPSFYAPIEGHVGTSEDSTLGMRRVEVHCAQCGGHLGHIFPDGPKPTGLRYCINGVSLKFVPKAAA